MYRQRQNRELIAAALACLFATLLLYAPLAGAAWSAHSMACCTGDHCPIPQHHHEKTLAAPAADHDCGHDMGDQGGMTACSMSCCQNPDQPVVAGLAFVLPESHGAVASVAIRRTGDANPVTEIPRPLKPLSPPPRVA